MYCTVFYCGVLCCVLKLSCIYLFFICDFVFFKLADKFIMLIVIFCNLLSVIFKQFPGRPQITCLWKKKKREINRSQTKVYNLYPQYKFSQGLHAAGANAFLYIHTSAKHPSTNQHKNTQSDKQNMKWAVGPAWVGGLIFSLRTNRFHI